MTKFNASAAASQDKPSEIIRSNPVTLRTVPMFHCDQYLRCFQGLQDNCNSKNGAKLIVRKSRYLSGMVD